MLEGERLDGTTLSSKSVVRNIRFASRREKPMTQTRSLLSIKIAPKGMGLNDFVAQKEGFFLDEGLDVVIDWKTFRGTQSSWKGMEYFERPQDKAVDEQVIQGACLW